MIHGPLTKLPHFARFALHARSVRLAHAERIPERDPFKKTQWAGGVTISGNALTQTTKVTFNIVVAAFTVKSDSQITAMIPSGATTGKIVVTTKGGSATSAGSFTVN